MSDRQCRFESEATFFVASSSVLFAQACPILWGYYSKYKRNSPSELLGQALQQWKIFLSLLLIW